MDDNPVLSAILSRRSIRRYDGQPVPDSAVDSALEAGRWAPSGMNNQPWRFIVVRDRQARDDLSGLTKYTAIVRSADVCIAVYYHVPSGYNRDKDLMGIGACIENILLGFHSLGYGAVWLGEILARRDEVNSLLGAGPDCELAAVIAVGHPKESPRGKREPMDALILKRL
jgi:nitroreductase